MVRRRFIADEDGAESRVPLYRVLTGLGF